MAKGRNPEGFTIGQSANSAELAALLAPRAEMLIQWAGDDALWEE